MRLHGGQLVGLVGQAPLGKFAGVGSQQTGQGVAALGTRPRQARDILRRKPGGLETHQQPPKAVGGNGDPGRCRSARPVPDPGPPAAFVHQDRTSQLGQGFATALRGRELGPKQGAAGRSCPGRCSALSPPKSRPPGADAALRLKACSNAWPPGQTWAGSRLTAASRPGPAPSWRRAWSCCR